MRHPASLLSHLRRTCRAAALLAAALWLWPAAAAEPNPLSIALVAEVESIQPGTPFHAALHLRHPPGSHTYWKYPGIVGVPTSMRWHLPEGWSAGEIEWPAPERVFMFEIAAQGFEGEVVLPMRITPPASLKPGQRVRLEGRATWMCCGRTCHPGFQDLALELPVAAAQPAARPDLAPLFASARASIAKPCADWLAEAERHGQEVRLHLRPRSEAAKKQLAAISQVEFFTEDGLFDSSKPPVLSRLPDGLVLTQSIAETAKAPLPETLAAIVQTPQGWLPGAAPRSMLVRAALAR